jgi:hypothetical protein
MPQVVQAECQDETAIDESPVIDAGHAMPLLNDASGRPMGGFSTAKETAIYFEQLAHAWNIG